MGAELLLIRHGETPWNQARRLQGRADIPLTEEARIRLGGLRVPDRFGRAEWFSSPLVRATETARLLGASDPTIEPRLVEMDLGGWEGRTLADLRDEDPVALEANEILGLDMRPPDGESPRDVQSRLLPWLRERAGEGRLSIAVTHKGVIRAVLAAAYDWDMTVEPPVRLNWRSAHLFGLSADGRPTPGTLNIALENR
ncbi:MAG: histidine phosphatase family protein [Minwuiales bacterium]|nr:histidine phosphatase family protein [Minwuiales bacterium]